MRAMDLTGKRFGKLVARKQVDKKNNMWLCDCDCGNQKVVRYRNLTSNNTRSCGCLLAETAKERALKGVETRKKKSIDGIRIGDFNKKKYSNNSSGYTGVVKSGNKWRAEIIVKGVKHRLYGFETPEQAYKEGRLVLEKEYLPKEIRE